MATGETCSCSPGGPGCTASESRSPRSTPISACPWTGTSTCSAAGRTCRRSWPRAAWRRGGLAAAAARGAVVFAVCAGYQIVGTEFGGAEGEPVAGLGLLDISSGRGEPRGAGVIVAAVDPALGAGRLTGFENHQGVTRRGPEAKPLATVVAGVGNGDGTEGAYAGRVAGTYLHGPALVRNPGLADMLLGWGAGSLQPVDPRQEALVQQLRAERLAAQGAPRLAQTSLA